LSMISRQTDRLRPTMAGATVNCVTDMFMAHLHVAKSNRGWRQLYLLPCAPKAASRCQPPSRATVPAIVALSPWGRSESFSVALKAADDRRAAIYLKSR